MTRERVLCRLEEIPDGGARGLELPDGTPVVAVRRGGRVRVYVNRCPHTGLNLEWRPDDFLTPEGDLIRCATHDARFRIEDGLCVAGPCAGDALEPVPVEVRGGRVLLAEGRGA